MEKDILQDRPRGCLWTACGLVSHKFLSPVLFSAYTNSISHSSEGMTFFQYAGDMALVAHITGSDALSQYQQEISNLVTAFSENSLELNVTNNKNGVVLQGQKQGSNDTISFPAA